MSPAGSVDVNEGGIDDTLRLLLRDLAKEAAKPTIRGTKVRQRTVRRRDAAVRTSMALTTRSLVALSIVYGAIVALTVVTDYANIGVVVSVGAIIVGAGWALGAVLVPRRHDGS